MLSLPFTCMTLYGCVTGLSLRGEGEGALLWEGAARRAACLVAHTRAAFAVQGFLEMVL